MQQIHGKPSKTYCIKQAGQTQGRNTTQAQFLFNFEQWICGPHIIIGTSTGTWHKKSCCSKLDVKEKIVLLQLRKCKSMLRTIQQLSSDKFVLMEPCGDSKTIMNFSNYKTALLCCCPHLISYSGKLGRMSSNRSHQFKPTVLAYLLHLKPQNNTYYRIYIYIFF